MSFRKSSAPFAGENTPSTDLRRPRLLMRSLQKSHYRIHGFGGVRCTLWILIPLPRRLRCPPVYAIGMAGLGARRLLILGHDEAKACALYALLVRHTVTPCALRDVLEEWRDT